MVRKFPHDPKVIFEARGSEHLGQSAARASGACFVMGQAAGTAAALRIAGGFDPRRLRQTLRDDGND